MVCPLSGSTDLEPSPEASPIAHAPFGGDLQSGRRQISKFENFASALNPYSGIALIGTSAPNLAGFMAVGWAEVRLTGSCGWSLVQAKRASSLFFVFYSGDQS